MKKCQGLGLIHAEFIFGGPDVPWLLAERCCSLRWSTILQVILQQQPASGA
jgi:hypothetical protein